MLAALGYRPDEIAAMAGRLIETLMHPDDLGGYAEHVARIMALPDGATASFEYRFRRVQGTGGGIPAARLQQTFEPLHTTKPGGTGLGLYIVQEVVQAHGGTVTVQSTVGQGTTFTLTLPRAPGPGTADGTRS